MRTFSLEHSLLATLAYFDQFDYPLTALEAWSYLLLPDKKDYVFSDVLASLEGISISGRIESCEGYFFLKGRSMIVDVRKERYCIAEKKFRKALKMIQLLAAMPFVRMIGICNDMALSNARDDSDIDLFIIVKHGYIWVARAFCLVIPTLLGRRPSEHSRKDTMCLSFFVDEEALDMTSLQMEERAGIPDVHFVEWAASVYPVYDQGGMYSRLVNDNGLGGVVFPYMQARELHGRRMVTLGTSIFLKKCVEGIVTIIGTPIVSLIKWYQWKVLPTSLSAIANTDSRVVMNDSYLKFHANDRREQYRQGFLERLLPLVVEEV